MRKKKDNAERATPTSTNTGASPAAPAKRRLSVVIDGDVVERARNAVYWSPELTLASLTQEALIAALNELERVRGEPFPAREAHLKAGRPMK